MKQNVQAEIEALKAQLNDIHGEKTEIYSRVVGYFRPVQQWNDGKQNEFTKRKTFSVDKATIKAGIVC